MPTFDTHRKTPIQRTDTIGFDVRLHQGNPFNPFGRWVSLQGLAVDTPAQLFESEGKDLFARIGLEGTLGTWTWQAELSSSTSESDTTRFNNLDRAWSSGVNSDGVTPTRIAGFSGISRDECAAKVAEVGGTSFNYSSFFGGNCTILGAAPDPINPFCRRQPLHHPGTGLRFEERADAVRSPCTR